MISVPVCPLTAKQFTSDEVTLSVELCTSSPTSAVRWTFLPWRTRC